MLPQSLTELVNTDEKHELDIEQKIVEELLNSEKNLPTKTELEKPIKWSTLNTVAEFIKSKNLPISFGILDRFITTSFSFLISKDRKGRLEYIQALQSAKKELEEKPNPLSMVVGNNEIKRKN